MFRSFMKGGLGVLAAAVLAMPASLAAQQVGQVTGSVTDADTGEPLSSVQVSVEGTGAGTISDADGSFTVTDVPAGTHTVQIERLGYQETSEEDVEVVAGESTTLDVELSPTVLALQEIVATGLVDPTEGVRSPVSVGRVSRDDMPVASAGDPVESLQGRVPGVAISRTSGNPGEASSMMLRSPTSARTGTGEPLFVVDGVIMGSETTNIDALDIESIEVVRGAAAASLYGSRAASGVVSITTARGSGLEEGETQFSARTEYGRNSPVRPSSTRIPRTHSYAMNEDGTEFVDSDGNVLDRDGLDWRSDRHTPSVAFMDQEYPGETYDNLGVVLRPATFNNQNFSVFQNAGTTNFAITGNRTFEGGTLANQRGYERTSFRVNLDHQIRENLRLSVSSFHSRDHRDNVEASFADMFTASPDINYGARDEDGEFLRIPDPTTGVQNPLWDQANLDDERRRTRTMANADLTWDPVYWLTLSGSASYDRQDTSSRSLVERGIPFAAGAGTDEDDDGSITLSNSLNDTWNAEADITLREDFGALNVRTTVRGLWESENNRAQSASGEEFFIGEVPRINNTRVRDGSSSRSDVRAVGYFWDTAFDYDGRYIATFLLRRDGSSLFGPDNRWHNYYRAAGTWRMGQEDWFNISNVQEFQLRYARGTAGGRPGFSAQYETWNVGAGGVSQANLGNRDLAPETTTEQEVALEMILYDRFGVELVHAWQRTDDQLFERSVPAFTGFSQQWENGGTVTGHTTEARIEGQLIDTPEFGWNSMFVFDRTRGQIEEWPFACDNPTYRYICDGAGIYSIWGFGFIEDQSELANHLGGIDEAHWDEFQVNDEGYLVWVGDHDYTDGIAEDLWGTSGTVDGHEFEWGVPFTERTPEGTQRRQQIGDAAHVNFGLTNNVRWGQFSFHAHLQASVGGEAVNRTHQEMVDTRNYPGMDQSGRPDELKKPNHYYDALTTGGGGSGAFVQDADYLKLRTASVSYDVSQGQMDSLGLARMGVTSMSLGLVGRNLFTVTNYEGFDPEQALNLNTRSAMDRFQYPPSRNFTAEVSVTF